jgi:hypothetical protein
MGGAPQQMGGAPQQMGGAPQQMGGQQNGFPPGAVGLPAPQPNR